MASNTTILVTGANRGLGRGLAEHYLAQPSTTIIAGVRDPNHATVKSLISSSKGSGSSVIPVKIESGSATDAATAIRELTSKHSISHLDIVIANAGISKVFPPVSEARIEDMQEHWNVNVIGVVRLFQACFPLLSKAKAPKFIPLGTSAASMADMEKRNFPNVCYGTSKAALNYVTLKIHFENPKLCAFPIDPGWVQTDMGNSGAKALGLEKAEIPLEKSIPAMAKVIDESSKGKTSGKFMLYDGTEELW